MGSFVKPESVRLDLPDGSFITVKKRLTVGEREDVFARMTTDRRELRTAKVAAYLLYWSLTDGDRSGEGLPVPMSPDLPEQQRLDTIRSLDPDVFDEIRQAIDAHELAMQKEREAQKKILRGARESPAISSSPDTLAGAMSGSVS
jgi:hypothetical protein